MLTLGNIILSIYIRTFSSRFVSLTLQIMFCSQWFVG
jgi:hypothetical protein